MKDRTVGRIGRIVLFIGCAIGGEAAQAAQADVRVVDARGAPVADAVVTVVPRGSIDGDVQKAAPATKTIDQKNETFVPYIEIFRPGDKVVFHNSAKTRHHVYSFAPARQFEFVLAPGESSAPLQLDHIGTIAVGCNIHDRMITYFYVSDAPWIARTGADGRASLGDLPSGAFDVVVWHPQLRPGRSDTTQALTFAASAEKQDVNFKLPLLPDPRGTADRERGVY